MKRILAFMTLMMVLVLGASPALSQTITDKEWRAQRTAGQGYYVKDISSEEFKALEQTTIIQDSESITGYTVTFRYKDSEATRVRIRGEWTFSKNREVLSSNITYYTPDEWTPEMFVLIPGIFGDWPAYDMIKDEETGIWSYDIPLPSGTWSYRFIIGGVEGAKLTDYTDAIQTTDPNNRPFEYTLGAQNNSQVRVPFDVAKQLNDYSLQLPRTDDKVGVSEIAFYDVANYDGLEDGSYELCVYLPCGYDPDRAEPYKVLYLTHGGGVESATSWYNKGSLANMMDNLIADEGVESFVVVCMNNYQTSFNVNNLVDNILPFIEANYHVAKEKAGRATAGLSAGGRFIALELIDNPEYFNYFGIFSIRDIRTDDTIAYNGSLVYMMLDREELANARIYVSEGTQELMESHGDQGAALIYRLLELEVPFEFNAYPGGHQWTVWRENYVDIVNMILWK